MQGCYFSSQNHILLNLNQYILKPPGALPPHLLTAAQCDNLMTFFNAKIENIHQTFTPSNNSTPSLHSLPFCTHCPHSPSALHLPISNCQQITRLIFKSKSSTCQLDLLPTYLVESCLPALSSLIYDIIHSSLTSGVVPSPLKTASITPTIMKPGADPYLKLAIYLQNTRKNCCSLTKHTSFSLQPF